MDNRITPAMYAHTLFEDLKRLRDDMGGKGFAPGTIYYVILSAMGMLARDEAEHDRMMAMMRDIFGDMDAPILYTPPSQDIKN